MASTKRPTPAQLAKRIKKAPLEGRGFKLTLPVKLDWPDPLFPIDRDERAGVPPEEREVAEGEAAMALRTLQEAPQDNLLRVIRLAVKRYGGTRTAAEQLVAMEHDPLRPDTEVRNMQRKVQEWLQGKYHKAAGLNARRVNRLAVNMAHQLVLSVAGWWIITEIEGSPTHKWMVWNTPDTAEWVKIAQDVILAEGEGFVQMVIEAAQEQFAPYPVELVTVHALLVELSE